MNSDNKTPPAPVSIPLEERVQGLLLQLPHYRNSQILKVDCLVGDASARQYYRIWLKQSPVESMIAMIVNQNPGPVGGGPKQLGQDQTFVEMAHFFRQHTIPVPQVLLHAESANIILVEDVGRFSVRDYLEGDPNRIGDAYGTVASGSELLQQSVDLLVQLQQIAVQPHDLAAQRTVSIEKYIQEAMEFADHLLKPAGLRESESVVLKKFSEILSETIRAHPRCLSHFDYGTQNITVAKNGSIHLVDFQDACVVSRARDPYSLLNDRDIDQHLGESLQERLLQRFMSGYGWTTPERDSFVREYQEYGTHWDMRVSGRFALLQSQVGKERYGQWIPGTLRRLGRRLPKLVAQFPGLDDVIEISQRLLPEFREGVRSV